MTSCLLYDLLRRHAYLQQPSLGQAKAQAKATAAERQGTRKAAATTTIAGAQSAAAAAAGHIQRLCARLQFSLAVGMTLQISATSTARLAHNMISVQAGHAWRGN